MSRCAKRAALVLVMLAMPLVALAQSGTGRIADMLRPAAAEDFAGVWQLLPYPEVLQPKHLGTNPWPERCQVFGHHSDGRYSRFFARTGSGPCELHKASFWEAMAAGMPNVSTYQVRDGFVLITHRERKITEVWKIQIVKETFKAPTIEANEGDLIMELLNLQAKQVLWRRILRRIPQ